MRRIGIFEAKAKLSEICDEVLRSGASVVITRRGKPIVRIEPLAADRLSVWEDREEYLVRSGVWREEFEVPTRSGDLPDSPLDD